MRKRRPKLPPERDEFAVMADMCETCIFRPGNVMRLSPGRVDEMIRSVRMSGSYIPCHETMDTGRLGLGKIACRGLYDKYPTQAAFQMAERIGGGIVFVDVHGNVVGRETAR